MSVTDCYFQYYHSGYSERVPEVGEIVNSPASGEDFFGLRHQCACMLRTLMCELSSVCMYSLDLEFLLTHILKCYFYDSILNLFSDLF